MADARKTELLQAIEKAGLVQKFKAHPEWTAAFDYYYQLTGDYQLKMSCSSCYIKILKWLRSN